MRENESLGTGEAKIARTRIFSLLAVWLMVIAGCIGVLTVEPVVESEETENNITRSSRRGNSTLYVGGNGSGNYTKIQDAIDDAVDGDIVFVYSGKYYENIILNRSISLVGENIINTIINGSGTGDVILVTVENVIIQRLKIIYSDDYVHEGFSYQNHNAGIEIDNVQNCEIVNNNISTNLGDGIYVNNSINITITDNFFSLNNREAISIYKSSFISINRNNFSNNKYGIELRKSDDNSVSNNKGFMDVGFGISLFESNNNNIDGNRNPINTKGGIYLGQSSSNNLINNHLLENNSGIQLKYSSTNNNISGNYLSDILMMWTSINNVLDNNIFHGVGIDLIWNHYDSSSTVQNTIYPTNLVNGKPIYHYKDSSDFEIDGIELGQLILGNCRNVEIKNLNINNVSIGITIIQSSNINISQCLLFDNEYGIQSHSSKYINITRNFIINNTNGIYLYLSEINTINNNIIKNNFDGINSWGSVSCNIINNSIIQNRDDGISTLATSYNKMINNNISNNNWAMVFFGSSNYNSIENNNISNNDHGFFLDQPCMENIIRYNKIAMNKDYGIFINGSLFNKIYYNEFLNNEEQSIDKSDTTIWNETYELGGNFWSDYYDIDKFSGPNQDIPGRDGIGDSPYIIDSDSQDSYPLMEPFTPIRPFAPQNPIGFSGHSFINLTWSFPYFDGGAPILNYTIYKSIIPNQSIFFKEIGNVLSFYDTNVHNGVTYYYKITATNAIGEGDYSIEINVSPGAQPSVPIDLKIEEGDSFLNITWKSPISNGGFQITNYTVYKGTNQFNIIYFKEIGNITFFNDTDVQNNKTYYYKISATNLIGNGLLSDEINAIPKVTIYLDYDNDKLPDDWEREHGLNPNNFSDVNADFDNDSLTNREEFLNGTDPNNPDTDNDGLSDGDEIKVYSTNPKNHDSDGDNYYDGTEVKKDSDPLDNTDHPSSEGDDKNSEPMHLNSYWLIMLFIVLLILLILMIYLPGWLVKKKGKGKE